MKIHNKYILLSLFIIMWLPHFTDSWWAQACGTYNLDVKWCKEISNNYKDPYCVTSFSANDREASDVDYVKSCIRPALTNTISSIVKEHRTATVSEYQTRDVIELYCTSLYSGSNVWRIYLARPKGDNWDWRLTFDSHQSLFLHALCSSFTDNNWKKPFPFIYEENDLVWEAFKWDLIEILKLQQMNNWKNNCDLTNDRNLTDCDMAIYATKIYQGIMTDLYKIKYAQVLDVNTTVNFDAIQYKKVLNFMSGYYLMAKTELKPEYDSLKEEYPKTISVLESNQKYYKDVLETIKIIDNSKLSDLADSWCPVDWNITWLKFIACALHSSQRDWFSLTPSFVTLLYNELLHYRQFMTFYQKWLKLKTEAMGRGKSTENEVRVFQSKLNDFKKYFELQMSATERAERGFEEFNMTYPLHIWILLLQEKWEKFRNFSLSPEITLFYSLSEKLQNAQLPNWS